MSKKFWAGIAALVLGCAAVGAACSTGPVNVKGESSKLVPASSDFTIITIDWKGQKCDLAYAWVEHNGGSQYATGGPALANLGCYK